MSQERITFPSLDQLEITADLYISHENTATAFIVLFHQAGWSRGEYLEIAPKLNDLGFNVMAIDQRSGGNINDVSNETLAKAEAAASGTTFVDALQDLEAALRYAKENHATGKLLAWGSSYSSALALKLAGDQPDLADAVLAFSPGEYFARFGESASYIQDSAANITVPVFITSAGNEQSSWQAIFDAIPSQKTSYLPDTAGNHGSRALWEQFDDNDGYWDAVKAFLKSVS